MKFSAKEMKAHIRIPSTHEISITIIGLIVASILHAVSFRFGDEFWQAVTLRLYYLPVIYGAASSGLLLGFAGGTAAALGHFLVMQFPMQHAHGDHMTMQIEHQVEIPFLILLGLITGALRDHEKHEREQKNQISDQFGSYVSTEVRDDILKGNTALGGDEVEVTILFADIRNFTALSEKHTAAEIVTMLNQYFSEMVRAITQHGGTVNKFIGDAIMAVFGTPKKLDNHAESAVLAALEMLARLQAHNYLQSAKGEPTFDIGIGLHSGNAIAGNIGAESRKEYTVIGDAVNLASRVEGLTKQYEISLLLTESVVSRLESAKFDLREIDTVTVKGRSAPCILFEVVSQKL
jgi:adenylate cyclase